MSSKTFNTSDFLTPTVQIHPGCNVQSAEPFPIVELPDEMKLEVLKRLDLLDLKQFNQADRYWANFSSDHQLWRSIATRIGCPITGDPYSQVRGFTEDLLEKVRNIPGKKPDDIVQILSAKNPTIDEINKLQNWLKAGDTLSVWVKLALAIDEEIPDTNFNHSQAAIDKAKELSAWCTQHQNALGQVTELNLKSLNLTSLPPEIVNLTGLQELNLSLNDLESLPPAISRLTELRTLNLSHNEFTSFPPQITDLVNLERLNLKNNILEFVPPQIGNLVNLGSLNLKKNRLHSLAPQIGELTRLKVLLVAKNGLTSLPYKMGELTELRILDLSGNSIYSVPKELGNLNGLQILDLSNNRLHSVPGELSNLTGLEALDLSENGFDSLPAEFYNLPEACTVYL